MRTTLPGRVMVRKTGMTSQPDFRKTGKRGVHETGLYPAESDSVQAGACPLRRNDRALLLEQRRQEDCQDDQVQGQADPEGDLHACDPGLDPVQAVGLVRSGRGLLRFLVGHLRDLLEYLVQVDGA